jgi:hypothetical protein
MTFVRCHEEVDMVEFGMTCHRPLAFLLTLAILATGCGDATDHAADAGGTDVGGGDIGRSPDLGLTVTEATLVSIQVTPQQYVATGVYSDATTQDLSATATWMSGNDAVATVSATGLATGVTAGGPVTITATSAGISGTASLTVTAATLVSIAVTPVDPRVESDKTQQMTATGTYSDASTRDITASVTWSAVTATNGTLQNPVCTGYPPATAAGTRECINGAAEAETADVATITAGGLATAVGATGVYTGTRTATLTATFGSVSGSTTLRYGPKPRRIVYVPGTDEQVPDFPDDQNRLALPIPSCGSGDPQFVNAVYSQSVNQGAIPLIAASGIDGFLLPAQFSTSGLVVDETVQVGCFLYYFECETGVGIIGAMCHWRY